MKLGKHQRSKQRCQDLGWKGHDRAQSFVLHSCMNYVTNTFLLVSSSVRRKQLLCFVHGQGQNREQKTKFVGFHNHSPLLTMLQRKASMGKYYKRLYDTVMLQAQVNITGILLMASPICSWFFRNTRYHFNFYRNKINQYICIPHKRRIFNKYDAFLQEG